MNKINETKLICRNGRNKSRKTRRHGSVCTDGRTDATDRTTLPASAVVTNGEKLKQQEALRYRHDTIRYEMLF